MASLINIGVNGLIAQQSALNTTGNNITNANTPGYSRQRVELATLPEQLAGAGYTGQGVQVTGINRIIDQFLINQLRIDTSSFHQADSLTSQFSQLDSLLADASTGVAPALQGFFDALQQASLDPTSIPVRQVVLGAASTLAQRFDSLYGRLQTQERVINEQLSALADQVTGLADGIASLNQQIAQQTSAGAQPNALLDKRDELTRQLSELVGVSVVPQSNGMMNVFIGNGQPLVVGGQSSALSTRPSADDASRYEILFSTSSSTREIGGFLSGGQIGGLLQYRSEGLDKTFNALGQMALTVAEEFNSQQRKGMDLDGHYGANGTDLFADINSAGQMTNRAFPSDGNAGNARLAVEITGASGLTASDYRLLVTGSDGGYELTRLSDGETFSGTIGANPADEHDGFSIQFGGTSGLGDLGLNDIYTIRPTRQGADALQVAMTDPRDLALAQPLRIETGVTNAGSGTLAITELPTTTLGSTAHMETLFPLSVTVRDDPVAGTLEFDFDPAITVPVTGTVTSGDANFVTVSDDGAGGYSIRIEDSETPMAGNDVYRFTLSGQFKNGDEFGVELNQSSNGTSDNRNALAMLDLRLEKLVGATGNVGGQTLSGSYGSLVSNVGSRTAELKINQEAADSVLVQSQANRDATAGVNLDEEAANLIRFEQAYNASAQVISVARSLFDSLLAAFR